MCASSAPLTSSMTLTHNSSTIAQALSCSIGGIPVDFARFNFFLMQSRAGRILGLQKQEDKTFGGVVGGTRRYSQVNASDLGHLRYDESHLLPPIRAHTFYHVCACLHVVGRTCCCPFGRIRSASGYSGISLPTSQNISSDAGRTAGCKPPVDSWPPAGQTKFHGYMPAQHGCVPDLFRLIAVFRPAPAGGKRSGWRGPEFAQSSSEHTRHGAA